ncbi:MAG: type II toxin-antitoxin system VapC family toxin [Gemmatimonadota bacterium]|nr:MAG: type II toxin-antitoxin system VapC family toxin [Gemmatimonadota bacterium]
MRVFIDSNIPMYVAGREHPNRGPARAFLARVRNGEVEGCTSAKVLQEILYRYAALQRRDLAREVYDIFVEICPVVFDVTLADADRALHVLSEFEHLSPRQAVHAAVMLNQGVDWIASFDSGFDRVRGVRRVELTV